MCSMHIMPFVISYVCCHDLLQTHYIICMPIAIIFCKARYESITFTEHIRDLDVPTNPLNKSLLIDSKAYLFIIRQFTIFVMIGTNLYFLWWNYWKWWACLLSRSTTQGLVENNNTTCITFHNLRMENNVIQVKKKGTLIVNCRATSWKRNVSLVTTILKIRKAMWLLLV